MPATPATELTDLADLGLDEGGHLLVARALARRAPGERLAVSGRHPALRVHLAAWCREHGHQLADGDDSGPSTAGPPEEPAPAALVVVKGSAGDRRWLSAARAGEAAGPPGGARRPDLGPGGPRRARRGGRPADRRPVVAA